MKLKAVVTKICCILIFYGIWNNAFAVENLINGGDAEDSKEIKKWAELATPYSADKQSGNFSFKKIAWPKSKSCCSPEFIPIDTNKSYCLSGYFKGLDRSKTNIVCFGLKLFDKDKKAINSQFFNAITQTEAVLIKPVKKGDKILIVSGEAARWGCNRFIAFNTEDDYSDIPNKTLSSMVKKIEIQDTNYEITLSQPMNVSYPAGTKLRLHGGGNSTPIYATGTSNDWIKLSAIISGVAPSLRRKDKLKFLPGTKYVKVYIFNRTNILFDDINLTEVKGQEPPSPVTLYVPPLLFLKCKRDTALYKCGEEASFSFYVKSQGKLLKTGEATALLSGSDGSKTKNLKLDLSKSPITITGTLNKPGFLSCRVIVNKDNKNFNAIASAGFEPEKIQPSLKCPSDFMQFWKDSKAELDKIPPDVQLTKLPVYSNDKYDSFKISVANLGGTRSYGFLCVPKGPGPFPAIVTVPGAGTGVTKPDVRWSQRGALFLSVNVFHQELPLDSQGRGKAYRELNKGKWYFFQGSSDRRKYYYRKSILGVLRMLDYLTQRPDWNKKVLVMAGFSQGGGFSLIISGLVPKISALAAGMPALCDFGAIAPGWPTSYPKSDIQEVIYYDAVNFSRNITSPALVTVGFIDGLCTPSSVYAAYNQLKGPKKILCGPLSGHGSYIPIQGANDYIFKWLLGQLGLGEKLEPTKKNH